MERLRALVSSVHTAQDRGRVLIFITRIRHQPRGQIHRISYNGVFTPRRVTDGTL